MNDNQPDLSNKIERFFVGSGLLFLTIAVCLIGCRSWGQEGPTIYVEPAMRFPTNHDLSFNLSTSEALRLGLIPSNAVKYIERRAAQPMIPPLPPLPLHPAKLLATFTNDNGEVIEFRLRKPAALQMPRKSWTNAFWVACPECDGEAIRKPVRMEKMGTKTVEDGDEHEYFIYFRCCGQEFKSRYLRRVTTPIAVPVQVPVR